MYSTRMPRQTDPRRTQTEPRHTDAFDGERKRPWKGPQGLPAVIRMWQADGGLWRNVVLHEHIDGKEAVLVDFPESLDRSIQEALRRRGIERLYSHQAEAFQLAATGKDLVVATPTASGKSLCYNLPVMNALAADADAKAMFLFPTKALSRDQENALRSLLKDAGLDSSAITYDGDTPADARRAARHRSGVLMTNPDMLHTGILPHHASWVRFFSGLKYVVIDEIHTYRGVFGSHLANVIRRLIRIARFHGSDPVFVFASATIGNPAEHAGRMLGRGVRLVDQSGAPAGPGRLIVYNPPVVNSELGIRQSYVKTAVRLTCDLVRAGVTVLVFGQTRNNVEVMLKYLRDRLYQDRIDPEVIHAYRGGYLPETRRRIEADLRQGALRCVVATNALELGIDIGSIDAVVCAGYPGTIAALKQRFGRGGRRGDESLALLVPSSAPLDQYVARERHYLVGSPIEQARIDPDNLEILMQHLKCAAFENRFQQGEGFGDLPPDLIAEALEHFASHQLIRVEAHPPDGASYHWQAGVYPANDISLRSAGEDNFVIIDREHDRAIGEMDFRAAHTMLHEQAIYQQGGEQYQVEKLDFDNRKAFVRKVAPDYFTDAMTYVSVSVLDEEETENLPTSAGASAVACRGDVRIVERVVGYKKIKYHTHENVGYGEVDLPDMQMDTAAFWLTVPERVVEAQKVVRARVIDALAGLGHALHTVAAVGLMTDPRDLGMVLGDRIDPDQPPGKRFGGEPGFNPTIFLYERVAGGIGLASRLFDEKEQLVRRTRQLIRGCTCPNGCPACVGPIVGDLPEIELELSRKQIALDILDTLEAVATH